MPPYIVEAAAAVVLVLVLLADMAGRKRTTAVWAVYCIGMAAVLALAVAARQEGTYLNGAYTADGISWIARILVALGALLAGGLSLRGLPLKRKYNGAYAALLIGASVGMMILVSSRDLLTMYVGLETSAISLYGLAGIAKADDLSLEAGIKYLVTGALASGLILYGIALIYAATGATTLDALKEAGTAVVLGGSALAGAGGVLLPLGMLLLFLGVGFKLSMVPLHIWTPDVYQGAPTAAAAFISVASKAAGFVFAMRLFLGAFAALRGTWEPAFLAAAVATMTLGNLAAIPQKSVKRLLGYSSISQAGYILVGFVGGAATGSSAVLFYLFVYTFTNIAAFAAVTAVANVTGSDSLSEYDGLARREPALALVFTLALLSLAGIPPLAGFIGKFYLFAAAMSRGYLWLVIVATLNSVVSLFYYLLVLRRMYIAEPAVIGPRIPVSVPVTIVLVVTTGAIVVLGILPGPIMTVIGDVSTRVFGGL
jgi:NADH-quinone oxidoreductase subunit N